MNERIIYIDDNIDDLHHLVLSLRDEGFEVRVINDSKNALEYIKNQFYDIVLLDLDMGHKSMSGNQLFNEIRKVSKKVPVVIISGVIKRQQNEDFLEFINNEAKAIFSRTEDNKKIVAKIKEIRDDLNISTGSALEDWLEKNQNLDAVLLLTKDGKSYTAKEILDEIKMRTDLGRKFERDLNKLTIDLISRGKERIE